MGGNCRARGAMGYQTYRGYHDGFIVGPSLESSSIIMGVTRGQFNVAHLSSTPADDVAQIGGTPCCSTLTVPGCMAWAAPCLKMGALMSRAYSVASWSQRVTGCHPPPFVQACRFQSLVTSRWAAAEISRGRYDVVGPRSS